MMDFNQKLQKAIERGQHISSLREQAEAKKAMTEEELRRQHNQFRLQLSEHIENCLVKLSQHFPGFQTETILGKKGWGTAVSRDDIGIGKDRRRGNFFSRFEVVVRPLGEYLVLDLAAKGTIRNKELLTRSYYQQLSEVDLGEFTELVDKWTLEYAELYAAKN